MAKKPTQKPAPPTAVTPAWRPGEAHFTGSPKTEPKQTEQADETVEARLKALEDEIDQREK